MPVRRRRIEAGYIRNFVFGVEDSLVSTVGLLSGIAIAGVGAQTILLTGMVLVFVEAFSMGVGSFLSEESAEEYLRKSDGISRFPITAGAIMFTSYLIAGFVPLLPYAFLEPVFALWISVLLSLGALFLLGVGGAAASGTSRMRSGVRMFLLGGVAIVVGVTVGRVVNSG